MCLWLCHMCIILIMKIEVERPILIVMGLSTGHQTIDGVKQRKPAEHLNAYIPQPLLLAIDVI